MGCPKCAGLLIQEEIHEHSGRFHGLRCIQCGLRLDQTIVDNQHADVAHRHSAHDGEGSSTCVAALPAKTSARPKRRTVRR